MASLSVRVAAAFSAAIWLAAAQACLAQDSSADVPPLADWRALDRGDSSHAKRWRCWQRGAAGNWEVAVGPGGVRARPTTRPAAVRSGVPIPDTAQFSGPRAILEQPDGVWLGIDRGEFGGGLWWLPRAGGPPQQVSQENVRGIVVVDGQVTALSGLAHMGWNQGALLQPELAEPGVSADWKLRRIRPLGAAPQAYFVQASDEAADLLWIATYKAILRVEGGRVRRIHALTGWPLIESIVVKDDGVIYLGMRGGVGRLTPTWRGHEAAWLVPPGCAEVTPETCECRPSRVPTENEPWPTAKP